MVSTTDVGGGKLDGKANWKKPKPGTHISRFTGAATSESVLHNKVITSVMNQDGQIITLVEAIPIFIGMDHYVDWDESFCSMTWKTETDFMTTKPHKRDYGTVDALGAFHWRAFALDTEEDYNRDLKI